MYTWTKVKKRKYQWYYDMDLKVNYINMIKKWKILQETWNL